MLLAARADQNGKEIPSRNGMSRTAQQWRAGGRLDRDAGAARGNKAEEETYGIETVNCLDGAPNVKYVEGENDRATYNNIDVLGSVQLRRVRR